jgi:hypothetical protein
MGVRPNISSLTLEGKNLIVRGESDDPLPTILQVVVVQDGTAEDGRGEPDVQAGGVEKIVTSWKATIKDTTLEKGPVQTLGIEIRVDPYDVCSWVQSLEIE